MMKQGFPPLGNYKVMVQCITYNQSKYIEDTLIGFAKQQTNFPFICCVFDDASTDGEQEVLNTWIDSHCNPEDVDKYDHPLAIILMAPDKNNPNCIYAMHLQKVNTWGKPEKQEMIAYWEKQCEYIALCEGDDYWISPFKLQRQVYFLENNPDYSMCFHRANIDLNGIITTSNLSIKRSREISIKEVIYGGGDYCATASLFYRTHNVLNIPSVVLNQYVGDYPLQIYLASKGKVYFMHDIMSVYRKQSSGSWTESFKNLSKDEKLAFFEKEKKLLSDMNCYLDYKYDKIFKNQQNKYLSAGYASMKEMKIARTYFYKLSNPFLMGIKYALYIHGFGKIKKFLLKYLKENS